MYMRLLGTSATLLLLACGDPPTTKVDCSKGAEAITGSVVWGPTMRLYGEDLIVTGTTDHQANLAIRQVRVAGLPATSQSFNYATWTATIPSANLAALANQQNLATVQVVAEDACGTQKELGKQAYSIAVRVEPTALTLTFPKAQSFIPADGQTAVELQLSANPESVGALVALSATLGSTAVGHFQGVGNGNMATLTSDGSGHAAATALFTSDQAGTILLGARNGSASWPARAVLVAGPPQLLPATFTLKPGQRVGVSAISSGALRSCSSTSATGLTVTQVPNGSARIDLEVAAASMLAAPASVTITCVDPFGQSVGGTFDAAP